MRWLVLFALVTACAESHAASVDAPTDAFATVDAAVRVDAFVLRDAFVRSLRPITREQASCLGLDPPQCAGCHERDGVFYLWPDAPPPPAGVNLDLDFEACGVEDPSP